MHEQDIECIRVLSQKAIASLKRMQIADQTKATLADDDQDERNSVVKMALDHFSKVESEVVLTSLETIFRLTDTM